MSRRDARNASRRLLDCTQASKDGRAEGRHPFSERFELRHAQNAFNGRMHGTLLNPCVSLEGFGEVEKPTRKQSRIARRGGMERSTDAHLMPALFVERLPKGFLRGWVEDALLGG